MPDAALAGRQIHHISLPTGELSVNVTASDLPLEELCGFAARRNPKRGFLFVSRVLGKHIPVIPSVMRNVHTLLAGKIDSRLPGPVVFIGMAETAVALGHGVFDEYVRLTGRDDAVFIHSTRYRLDQPVALEFIEAHSHAADHIIYRPIDDEAARLFESARTLVLVDDEASTGNTFVNLTTAFKQKYPRLERVVTAMITDWRGAEKTASCQKRMPVPSDSAALLEGSYAFEPAPNLVATPMPNVVGDGSYKDRLLPRNSGRLGLPSKALALPRQRLGDPHGTHLVLGTGEFTYLPFLLAEQMEQAGCNVRYQSTTRSPIIVAADVKACLSFTDNYGDGIANFLYNVESAQYDSVIVCHETPAGSVDPLLTEALCATTVEL